MTITYRRTYYGAPDGGATAPASLTAEAEALIPFMHPARRVEMFSADAAPHRLRTGRPFAPATWIVTFTPEGGA